MVVCKFFQQGNCRYGQSCRFDHIYGSKYSYHAVAPQAQNSPQSGVMDEQLLNQVMVDVQAALKGKQWILSCYSPYKEKPNFPGITDLSMEEARLFIYEAKTNNNLDQAFAYFNNLVKESTQKYEQLLQASPMIMKVLQSLYKGETVPSPFANNTSNGVSNTTAATSIFRSAMQGGTGFGQNASTNASSIFNQSPVNASSVFGQQANTSVFNQSPGFGQNQVSQTASVFGQASPDSAKSIFGQANQDHAKSVFGQTNQDQAKSIFGQASQDSAKSIFGQANQENAKSFFSQAGQNVFGSSQSTNVFSPTGSESAQSIFSHATQNAFSSSQPANPTNVFGEATQSAFGMASRPFGQHQTSDSNIYSDMNEMIPEHVEAYKADDFKLGFIPEVAPPSSLCF